MSKAAAIAANHGATILVVEDDRPLQDAIVTTLETAGFNVLVASAKPSRRSTIPR
jgi:DNA-binding response OmpR family regulator